MKYIKCPLHTGFSVFEKSFRCREVFAIKMSTIRGFTVADSFSMFSVYVLFTCLMFYLL